MGKTLKYKVQTKVQRLPIPLEKLFQEISIAYGNSDNKEMFIVKMYWYLNDKRD